MMKAKKISFSKTTMTEMIMPNDTNPLGNLMGGNLMRWMDIAASICAGKHCEANVVTASVDHLSFKNPIRLGDVITIKACITRAFNTSLEVFLKVSASNLMGSDTRDSNEAFFTFVALDQDSLKPIKIPQVVLENEEEKELYDGALKRRELRLILAGRMHPKDAAGIKDLFVKS